MAPERSYLAPSASTRRLAPRRAAALLFERALARRRVSLIRVRNGVRIAGISLIDVQQWGGNCEPADRGRPDLSKRDGFKIDPPLRVSLGSFPPFQGVGKNINTFTRSVCFSCELGPLSPYTQTLRLTAVSNRAARTCIARRWRNGVQCYVSSCCINVYQYHFRRTTLQ